MTFTKVLLGVLSPRGVCLSLLWVSLVTQKAFLTDYHELGTKKKKIKRKFFTPSSGDWKALIRADGINPTWSL